MSQTPSPQKSGAAVATFALIALVVAIVVGGLWWVRQNDDAASSASEDASTDVAGGTTDDETTDDGGSSDGDGGRGDGSDADPGLGDAAEEIAAQDFPDDPRVVVISVDSLGSLWVSEATTPTLADLLEQGAGTLNARTEVEKTVTLPNHTGMVTGVRVNRLLGGHGVTWNDTSTRSVAPRDRVGLLHDRRGRAAPARSSSARRSSRCGVGPGRARSTTWTSTQDQTALVTSAIAELQRGRPRPGLPPPGRPGHTPATSRAGAVIPTSRRWPRPMPTSTGSCPRSSTTPSCPSEVVVVVTADHGGVPGLTKHDERRRSENYTIPFVVWGPGSPRATSTRSTLTIEDPGDGRPRYFGPQPVRNGDVANVVTDLLGLDPVPRSQFGVKHDARRRLRFSVGPARRSADGTGASPAGRPQPGTAPRRRHRSSPTRGQTSPRSRSRPCSRPTGRGTRPGPR